MTQLLTELVAGLAAVALAAASPTGALGGRVRSSTPDTTGSAPMASHAKRFDLQAHRGGIGLTTEEQPAAFAKALRLGVTTLELDTQITKDGKVVVTHDRQVQAAKCRDTAPATPGDQQFPYVGKFVRNLTLAQIKTLDCGYQQLPGFDQQEVIRGARMAELRDVFDVVKAHRAWGVMLNIETKVEAGAPEQTAPREMFVRTVYQEIRKSGLAKQVTIQSFDWGALKLMHRLDRRLPLVALTNFDFLQVGKPGASPWLGGIDADDFGGDFVAAAASIEGVTTLSPNYGFPQDGKLGDPGFRFHADADMVRRAHARGLKVVPWTVDDVATAAALMDADVDGLITNYPDRMRALMAQRGMKLPKPYHLDGT